MGEEGAWEGRLCKEIGRERVDVPVVQRHLSEVAATADEEGVLTWVLIGGRSKSNMGRREEAGNRRRAGRWEQRRIR